MIAHRIRSLPRCCLLIALIYTPLTAIASADNEHVYAALTHKSISWYDSSTSSINFDAKAVKEVDFTLRLADNIYVGVLFGLDDQTKDGARLATYLGFGEWGLKIEKGTIGGRFEYDPNLQLQLTGQQFSNKYESAAIYKSKMGGASQSGIGYMRWVMPTKANVQYDNSSGFSRDVDFVDPGTEYQLVGYYMRFDQLRAIISAARSSGWNVEPEVIIGYIEQTPSTLRSSAIRAVTGKTPTVTKVQSIGSAASMRFGYFAGRKHGEGPFGAGFGFAAGYEIRVSGAWLNLDSSVTANDTIQTDPYAISHGLFLRLGANW